MAQIANYIGLYQVYDSPREIIENSINTYINNFKSSSFYLNDLTESFKYTNGIFQRSSSDIQILEFKEYMTADIQRILNRYFDNDSIVNNIVDMRVDETSGNVVLHIEMHIEVVVDGLSFKFDNNYSVLRKGG